MSNLILILWLGLMSYALYLAYLTVIRVKAARLSPKRRRNREDMKQVFRQWQGNKFDSKIRKSKSHGLSGLWHQLLIRVNFDIPTAERLVANLQRKHPGKNDKWYIEKAIWDLERDKGRY
jgi:hypothetical protein